MYSPSRTAMNVVLRNAKKSSSCGAESGSCWKGSNWCADAFQLNSVNTPLRAVSTTWPGTGHLLSVVPSSCSPLLVAVNLNLRGSWRADVMGRRLIVLHLDGQLLDENEAVVKGGKLVHGRQCTSIRGGGQISAAGDGEDRHACQHMDGSEN